MLRLTNSQMQLETTINVTLAFYKQCLNWKVFGIAIDNLMNLKCVSLHKIDIKSLASHTSMISLYLSGP